MKLIELSCTNCGAQLSIDEDRTEVVCQYCGTKMLVDKEKVNDQEAEEAGYQFEKGRQRAQEEAVVPDKKKNNMIWWVLGWIFFFPAPVTILIARSKKLDTKWKAILLTAFWGIFLIMGAFSSSEEENKQLVTEQETMTESVTEQRTTVQEEVEATQNTDTVVLDEDTEEITVNLDCSYAKLSDEQFALLTEMLEKTFYAMTIEEEDYQRVESDEAVLSCLNQLMEYAYENNWELDPDYRGIFTTKQDVVVSIPNYDELQEDFIIDRMLIHQSGEWVFNIRSYSVNPDDVLEQDGEKYIDADGYLAKGVVVYWKEDGVLEAAGEVVDIAYNQEIDGVQYAYAINVDYYDVPEDSGWRDGVSFLRTNKELGGEPLYYIKLTDENRSIIKEEIDYAGSTKWYSLGSAKIEKGLEVYMGRGSAKVHQFTIESFDKSLDQMVVVYPDGSKEIKSYSAMLENDALYVK